MSNGPNLKVVPSAPEDAWVRRLADLIDGDQWTLADTLLEHYPLDEFPESKGDAAHNGLHVALRQDEVALKRQFGIIATVGHLRTVRATAVAWPRGARAPRASFDVHKRIRGEDRQQEMAKRLRQADREGAALSRTMLSRYRADERQEPGQPYEERMRRRIAAAVKREMLAGYAGVKRDDWWMLEQIIPSLSADDAQTNRDVAVRELRALASKIARGAIEP